MPVADFSTTKLNGNPARPLKESLVPFYQVYEIPVLIAASHRTNAVGDFCAKGNFMNTAYAERLGLKINRRCVSSVTIANGKKVITSGTVKTLFRFGSESQTHSLVFHLLPCCIHDVILGKTFLTVTRTFSSLANQVRRVKQRKVTEFTQDQYDCLYLGDSAPRFIGLLNGQYGGLEDEQDDDDDREEANVIYKRKSYEDEGYEDDGYDDDGMQDDGYGDSRFEDDAYADDECNHGKSEDKRSSDNGYDYDKGGTYLWAIDIDKGHLPSDEGKKTTASPIFLSNNSPKRGPSKHKDE
ncbi:hypothetical protein EK21DRAFT_109319 [Setomelanomma holmii]|uniref:Uncharacterized protein n=1 Tax=Setomelanomma holmii TaxID=210430 RepID=A0A9P4HHK7_9PLEO|nr:hypothetical protein EK21DRAFT_109319 [Setomelanomma holmii]